MSWSYSGNPTDSDRDAVRYLVQDVNRDTAYVTNEEIDYELAQQGSVNAAAVVVAESIAARLPLLAVDVKAVDRYDKLLLRLRRRLAAGTSAYVGGISDADKDAREDDSDRTRPSFGRDTLTAVGSLDNDG